MFIVNEIQKCKNLIHIIDDHFGQGKDQVKVDIEFMFSDIVNVYGMLREFKNLADTRTVSTFKGFVRTGWQLRAFVIEIIFQKSKMDTGSSPVWR